MGANSSSSAIFDDVPSAERAHRRRASTSGALGLAPLDTDMTVI